MHRDAAGDRRAPHPAQRAPEVVGVDVVAHESRCPTAGEEFVDRGDQVAGEFEGVRALALALERTLASFAAALRGYALDPADEVHALRMHRSVLHGFATIEVSGGFQFGTDVDASFAWMVDFLDRGFRAPRP